MDNERQMLQHKREMEQLKNEQLRLQLEVDKTKTENSRSFFGISSVKKSQTIKPNT